MDGTRDRLCAGRPTIGFGPWQLSLDGVEERSVAQRMLLAGFLALCAPSFVAAEEWAAKMFDATKHDFGKVARGAKVEFHFKFRNLYIEDVHVASVRSSCGCTSPRVSQEPVWQPLSFRTCAQRTRAFWVRESPLGWAQR